MRDEINLCDVDYENASMEKKSRQIRTKGSSFTTISENFTNFRINLLNKKLEEKKKDALNTKYVGNADGLITKKDEERMMDKAEIIARLEEKIKVLEGDEVPVDYVNRRAIKIKRAMMDKIKSKSVVIYQVGEDSAEDVFDKTEVDTTESEVSLDEQKAVSDHVRHIMRDQKVDLEEAQIQGYVPDAITRAEIKAEIDEAFDNVKTDEVQSEEVVEETPHINLDEIKASIDEAFNEKEFDSESEATIGPEIVKDVVDESINLVEDEHEISLEDIKSEIDEAMEQVVSKNGSTNAKLDRFNEDGTRKYDYVPMTDEEIKAAQANIEYDKYEEIYRLQNQEAFNFKTAEFKDIFKPATNNNLEQFSFAANEEETVREVPVIVSEVEGERIVSPETAVVSRPTSLEEFSELKAKVVELKKKLAESENRKNTAVQFATRTASRAEEIKKITIASEKEYQDRLASLQLLAKTLEENCNLNDTAARTATMDAECNERFISSQMSKKNQYDKAIEQVDTILGEAPTEEVSHRRRAA